MKSILPLLLLTSLSFAQVHGLGPSSSEIAPEIFGAIRLSAGASRVLSVEKRADISSLYQGEALENFVSEVYEFRIAVHIKGSSLEILCHSELVITDQKSNLESCRAGVFFLDCSGVNFEMSQVERESLSNTLVDGGNVQCPENIGYSI